MEKLYRVTGFVPFIVMIFLNAFVDLGHKIIIQNTVFKVYDGQTQIILTAIVNGLILLPFVMLYTPTGFLADRFRKPLIMRISAIVAVGLTLLITLSYYQGWFNFAFAMTFLLATQSAFYSPAKYGYIREIAGKDRLARANGAVQASTIVAILAGVFVFSILFENALAGVSYANESELIRAIGPIGWILVGCTLLELYTAYRLPTLDKPHAEPFDWGAYITGRYLKRNLTIIRVDATIWLSIIGLSLFWGVSQVVLATFPAFAKEHLDIINTVVIQGLLACSGIGIVIGSLLAGRISDKYIETGLIPVGALGMVITLSLLPQLPSTTLLGLNILCFGLFGGLFIIPLNALIQFHAREEQLGVVLAGNNLIQNIVMLSFLVLTMIVAFGGIPSSLMLHLVALVALIGATYTIWRLPQSLIRYLLGLLFRGAYHIRVEGFHNIPSQGAVLMLGNHISWLDWAIIQIASPRPIRFVMHRAIYQRWYLKWFFKLFGVIPIARGHSKASLEQVNQLLKRGEVVCLFPEGSISRTGHLGRFKRGFERTVDGVDGIILPFYLRGLWGSRLSRSSQPQDQLHTRVRRDIIIAFGEPLPINSRAEEVKRAVFELSIDAWRCYTDSLPPLPLAWIQRVKKSGRSICLTDGVNGTRLNRTQALTRAICYARRIRQSGPEQHIGLLLPTSPDGLLVNMAVLLAGKTLVNLPVSDKLQGIETTMNKAGIQQIYTTRAFIETLKGRGLDLTSVFKQTSVHYLDEMQDKISLTERLLVSLSLRLLPSSLIYRLFGTPVKTGQAAAVVFTCKQQELQGVVLSHLNIMSNIKQVSDVLDTRREDVAMATLPLSRAYGLTVTGLLPLIEGIHAVTYPDPTDVLNIARAIAKHKASLYCSMPSLLKCYLDHPNVHPLMLQSLRLVVAGAEPADRAALEAFSQHFGKTVYEGYGTTETTPVASVNIPDRLAMDDMQVQLGSKRGSVGMPLPGSSIRIVDPDTLENLPINQDGLILIGGNQVMAGYLDDPAQTHQVIIEQDGKRWYITGDIGHLDSDGFLTLATR